ncbi:hypothetical protein [Microbacterium schleiferi]|uniref:DUF4062 domain-containing protein n=1 Tax=Microbacterium schleiferi TaxID=69362 RepID=A0ABU7VA87_9MICO
MYNAKVIELLIASPGDLEAERRFIPNAISKWNADKGERQQCIFIPRMWEFDLPHGGYDPLGPQHLIDSTILARADACIALFWTTLGAPGANGVPNSVHELDVVRNSGRPTYLWTKDSSIPVARTSADRDSVNSFISSARKDGYLTGSFKWRQKLHLLLDHVLDDLATKDLASPQLPPSRVGDRFEVVVTRSGQFGYVSLKNIGDSSVDVSGVSFGVSRGASPELTSDTSPGSIAVNGVWRETLFFPNAVDQTDVSIRFSVDGSAPQVEVVAVRPVVS